MKDFNQTLITNAREEKRREEDRKRHTDELTDSHQEKLEWGEETENQGTSSRVKSMLAKVVHNTVNKRH